MVNEQSISFSQMKVAGWLENQVNGDLQRELLKLRKDLNRARGHVKRLSKTNFLLLKDRRVHKATICELEARNYELLKERNMLKKTNDKLCEYAVTQEDQVAIMENQLNKLVGVPRSKVSMVFRDNFPE